VTPHAEPLPDLTWAVVGMLAFLALEIYVLVRFRSGWGWSHERLRSLDREKFAIGSVPGLRARSGTEWFLRGGFAAVPAIVGVLFFLAFFGSIAAFDETRFNAWGVLGVAFLLLGVTSFAWGVKEYRRPSRWNRPPDWLAETDWWRKHKRRFGL
jgi:hypothetical protein